jgi:hypothetical protein
VGRWSRLNGHRAVSLGVLWPLGQGLRSNGGFDPRPSRAMMRLGVDTLVRRSYRSAVVNK